MRSTSEDGDTLLLCTDGLSEKVEPPELAAALAGPDLAAAVRSLVALANERGGEDNITVARGARSADLDRISASCPARRP